MVVCMVNSNYTYHMDKTLLTMSKRELGRYDIIKRLIEEEINGTEAAGLVGLSVRQTKRLKAAVLAGGPEGLIHKNRGRTSNRGIPEKERDKIVKLLNEKYHDFWPTHASEKLSELHNIKHDPKTIRSIMIKEDLWKPRKTKNKEHREWRQRRAFYGEMEQFDGSYHKWLEDRVEGKQCLLLSVDDATGDITHGKFDTDEGVFPVFGFWREYVEQNGKPMSIYTDKFSTYKMTQETALNNHDTKTQFQRAMAELGIEPIFANSPEAKGRVETMFRTLQNRLIKEMRLKNIKTVEQANKYLKEEFIPWYNNKYSVEPRGKSDLHKELSDKDKKQIDCILSRQENRTIQNDFTISFKTKWFQLLEGQPVTVQKKDKVIMEERLDGSIKIRLHGKYLNYKIIPKGVKAIKRNIPWVLAAKSVKTPIY